MIKKICDICKNEIINSETYYCVAITNQDEVVRYNQIKTQVMNEVCHLCVKRILKLKDSARHIEENKK